MSTRQLGALFLLAALWGASFLFIRVAVPELGPALLVELRVALAGAALVLYATAARRMPALLGSWKEFLVLGAFNAAIPFTLVSYAEIHVTASLAAVLIAATPLFTALVSAAQLGERLTVRKVSGLLMGMVGVAMVVGLGPVSLNRAVALSIAALLLAALSLSFASVYAKEAFKGASPLALAIGQQLAAAAILLPPAALIAPHGWPSTETAVSVAALALLSTAVGYLLYFFLIASAGPTKAVLVTFLMPAFGVLWGMIFLSERVTSGMLAGLAIVLSSVAIVAGTGPVTKVAAQNKQAPPAETPIPLSCGNPK